MSLATLVSNAKGTSQTTSVPTQATKGIGRLLASSKPAVTTPSAPAPVPQSFAQKAGGAILKGATAVTDFLTPGLTDVLSSDIAHATVPANQKQYITEPTAGQNVGAALQVGSLLLPATGAERIAGSVAEGAFTKAALQGAASGAQFGVLGGAGQALSSTPQATDKDIATQAAKQGLIGAGAGALLGLGGAVVGKGLGKLLEKSKPVESPVKVPVESEAIQNKIPISTPRTRATEYAKANGYEPYTPPDQLPTIPVGPKATSELPTIQTLPKPSTKLGDLTVEPIKEPTIPSQTPKTAPTATSVSKTTETTPVNVQVPKTTPTAAAPKIPASSTSKVSKIASSVNAKSVEEGLTSGFKDLAGYEPKVIKDQADKIANLMNESLDKTRAIVRGEEPVPSGISGTYLIKAAEDHAIATGNGEMLREITSSPLVSETSRYGQELRMAAERNPESPLKAIQDINKAREGRIIRNGTDVGKIKKKIVSDVKEEIRKTAPKKEDWDSFIEKLTC